VLWIFFFCVVRWMLVKVPWVKIFLLFFIAVKLCLNRHLIFHTKTCGFTTGVNISSMCVQLAVPVTCHSISAITFRSLILWGEVSLCDTPPTLIILQVNLLQYVVNATRITTDNWSLVTDNWFWHAIGYSIYYIESGTIEIDVVTHGTMDMKSTSRFLDTDTCRLLLMWKVPTILFTSPF
jgi:hypothetical protein